MSRDSRDANFNLAEYCLRENARVRPHVPALIYRHGPEQENRREVYTFQEFEALVLRYAGLLRGMVSEGGARVFIRLESNPDFALLFFAACAAGLVPVPSSPDLTSAEAEFLIEDSKAALIVYARAFARPDVHGTCTTLEELSDAASDAEPARYASTTREDPAFLIYTSGTSGRPKGVLHAHRSVLGRRPMRAGWTDLRPGDRLLHAGRLNWTYTLGVGLMDPWAAGATGILYGGPSDPVVWPRLMREENATLFAAVPGVYRRMLKYAGANAFQDLQLRHGLTAGEKLSSALRAEWREATGTELHEALGMSEVSTYISTGPGIPTRAGSPGRAQPGRRIAILADDEESAAHGKREARILPTGETGLLAVHRDDSGLMLRYWNRPEEQERVFRGEWFVGGDLAHLDKDGYVHYHGRADEIMNASGYRVSPQEVDRVLQEHPDVREAAASEWSPREGLSIIAAFVVLREGIAPGEQVRESILEFAAGRLAKYKQPREIHFMTELPRNANGKLRRGKLKEWQSP